MKYYLLIAQVLRLILNSVQKVEAVFDMSKREYTYEILDIDGVEPT